MLSEKCEVAGEPAPYARVFTVHPDLERLIRLQSLDLQAAEARRQQATIPETQRALDQKLESARAVVAEAKARQATNQTDRRAHGLTHYLSPEFAVTSHLQPFGQPTTRHRK